MTAGSSNGVLSWLGLNVICAVFQSLLASTVH